MKINRIFILALGGMLLAAPAFLAAQQGQESVADAARRAQAEKKNAPKAKMTIDNDNLNSLTGVVNVVGGDSTAAGQSGKAPAGDQTGKAAAPGDKAPVKDEAYWRGQFDEANKKLADDARELDVTQREYNLKQQQFYTDPNASLKQDYSREDLNDSKTKIDQLAAAVEQDKASISNLEDDLRKAGGDPGWATPSSQPAAPAGASQPAAPAGPSESAAPQPAQSQ